MTINDHHQDLVDISLAMIAEVRSGDGQVYFVSRGICFESRSGRRSASAIHSSKKKDLGLIIRSVEDGRRVDGDERVRLRQYNLFCRAIGRSSRRKCVVYYVPVVHTAHSVVFAVSATKVRRRMFIFRSVR